MNLQLSVEADSFTVSFFLAFSVSFGAFPPWKTDNYRFKNDLKMAYKLVAHPYVFVFCCCYFLTKKTTTENLVMLFSISSFDQTRAWFDYYTSKNVNFSSIRNWISFFITYSMTSSTCIMQKSIMGPWLLISSIKIDRHI